MVAQMADAILPLLFALSLAPTLLPLQGAAMGMDGITQGAAPLALGYALLPLQGDSPTPALLLYGWISDSSTPLLSLVSARLRIGKADTAIFREANGLSTLW